jgi:hypothetical protein
VCDAVARHFGITKAKIRNIAEKYFAGTYQPMLVLDLSEQLGVSIEVMCSKNTMPLSSMLFFNKLKKTQLYSDIINTFSNTAVDVLAYYSGGALVIIYPDNYYTGVGGVLVRGEGQGYVYEPIEHYLQASYPKDNYNES